MLLASQEAIRFNHEYIGTEHLLLGLLKEGSGVAKAALDSLDVDLAKLRVVVEGRMQPGNDTVALGKLPQTPRAKRVIEEAINEAKRINDDYVGSEHILLGLLAEVEGIAAQALNAFGVTLDRARETVLQIESEWTGLPRTAATTLGPACELRHWALDGVSLRYTSETVLLYASWEIPVPMWRRFA